RAGALLKTAVGLFPSSALYLGLCQNYGRGAGYALVGAIVWLLAARRSGWPGVSWRVFLRAWLEWALVVGLLAGSVGRLLAGWAVRDVVLLGLGMGAMFAFFAIARRAVLAREAAGGIAG
ncbi:MAG: hypothetical protein AB1816_06220, partial [Bacillota bacterium]